MALPTKIDTEVLMEFVAVFNHEYAGKEWSIDDFRTSLNNWMKPDWRKREGNPFEREQANKLLPLVIEAMFPYEAIETARPTRPENRIRAYNSRQADRREGAKRLLEKLHSR